MWQAFQIQLAAEAAAAEQGDQNRGRLLMHGDVVCLRAHTGKLLSSPVAAAAGMDQAVLPISASTSSPVEAQLFEITIG